MSTLERLPVRWDEIATYEHRELTARVVDAPPIQVGLVGRGFIPERIDIGFDRANGGAWSVAHIQLSGHANRVDSNGRTWPTQMDKCLSTARPQDWPAWVRDFVAELTPADAATGDAA